MPDRGFSDRESRRMIESAVSDLPEPDSPGEAQGLAGMKREAHVFEHRAQTFRRARVDAEIPNSENGLRHLGEDDPGK